MIRLNIGGQKGRRHGPFQSWKVVDVRKGAEVRMDIMAKRLPFNKDTVDAIYSSHTFEHIFPDRLPFVMSEMYRVLKKGHKVRLVVPDLDIAIKAYVDKDMAFLKSKRNPRKMETLPNFPLSHLSCWFFSYKIGEAKNKRLEGGHVMSFNLEVMHYYLKKAGFKDIRKRSYNDLSSIFKGCDFDRYKYCSLYVEAVKS